MNCPNCGFETESSFCGQCGTKVIAPEEYIENINVVQTKESTFKHTIRRFKLASIFKYGILIVLLACLVLTLIISFRALNILNNQKSEITNLKSQVSTLQTILFSPKENKTALLGTSDLNKYERFDSSTGVFLVSIANIQPYLDGYKVDLNIGNLSYASYNGFTITAKWRKDIFDFMGTNNNSQIHDFTFTNELKPGSWIKVEFVATPAKADEFKYLELSIETNTVSLLR